MCCLWAGNPQRVCIWSLAHFRVISTAVRTVPGRVQQLQGCSPQQWCPCTTHYLKGFSLSRCYSGRNGVKLRCKERLFSIGSLPLLLFTISLQSYSSKAGWACSEGNQHHVPRVCIYSIPPVTKKTQTKDVKFHQN